MEPSLCERERFTNELALEVNSVPMEKPLADAYAGLEQDIAAALQEHRGNSSVVSTALNALLLYPDRPFSIGPLWGVAYDEETKRRERFLIADPPSASLSSMRRSAGSSRWSNRR